MSAKCASPACAFKHQQLMAGTVAATKAAGVDCGDTVAALKSFVELVTSLRIGGP